MSGIYSESNEGQLEHWQQLVFQLEAKATPRVSGACGRVVCEPTWNWQVQLQDYDLWFAVQGHGEAWINVASLSNNMDIRQVMCADHHKMVVPS